MALQLHTAYLTGDYSLVKEWGSLLHASGVTPLCSVTSEKENGPLPDFCIVQNTVPPDVQAAFELTILDSGIKEKNIRTLDAEIGTDIPVMTSSVTVSTLEQSSWMQNKERLIGISAFPTLTKGTLIELAPSIHTAKRHITGAEDIAIQLTKEVAVIQDRVGMVLPRILCSLINEAFFAIMEGAAPPEHIDLAMKLGTNYPSGPIEWANAIGLPYVAAVLDAIHRDIGEERYRIAPLLRQMALGSKWWNG